MRQGRTPTGEVANGYALTASWLGDRALAAVAMKEGAVIGRVTYTVSPDGRTLTIIDGSGDSVIVLDRLMV